MFPRRISLFFNPPRFYSVNIPLKRLQISTSRSSGPGGQSVNKVVLCALSPHIPFPNLIQSETKVQIRFNVPSADWLTAELRDKFLTVHKARITQKGDFIVECDGGLRDTPDFASQLQNRKACVAMIRDALALAEVRRPHPQEYTPARHLTFLEQIAETKTPEEILRYKLSRRAARRRTKQLGHKKLDDF